MVKPVLLVLALGILAVAPSGSAGADGHSSPSPDLLFQLQSQNYRHPWLRVTTASGRWTLRAQRLDEAGLGGIRSRMSEPIAPDPLGWKSIARIDEVVTRARTGRITGFLLGGAVGLGLGSAIGESIRSGPQGSTQGRGGPGMVLGLALLGGLGGWQGGRIGERMVHERSWYVAVPGGGSGQDTLTAVPAEPSAPLGPTASGGRGNPSPDALVRLNDRLMRTRRVRVTTTSGAIVAQGVRAGAEGIAYRNFLGTTGGDRPNADRIPWDAVARIDVPSNHALAAALGTGLILGGLAGAAVYSAGQQGNDIGGGGVALLAVPVAVVLAAGVGALMPSWHPIYRK